MKIRHPLQLLNDRGRYFISRWSDTVQQDIKLSGFFENLETAERALAVWKAAEKLECEIALRN